ncbi:hypothetical protein ABK040_002575 [Willaertia magna]
MQKKLKTTQKLNHHILVTIDYHQDDNADKLFYFILEKKFHLKHKIDFEENTLCEGKYHLRFANISCEKFQQICREMYDEENGGLSKDRYLIRAYPDHMHSLPPCWYDDLCERCNNLNASNDEF